MKKGLGFILLLLVLVSCEVSEIRIENQVAEDIRNDSHFQALIIQSKLIGKLPPQEATKHLPEFESLIPPLNERFIEGRSSLDQEIFRKVFEDELGIGSSSRQLPYQTFSTEYEVEANIDDVWDAIINVDAYPDWNPFTPIVETDFTIGGPIIMHVRLFPLLPNALLRQEETVVEYSINELTCWETELGSAFFFRSHRCYELEIIDNEQTLLINSMVYEGLLAPLVTTLTRPLVLAGFHDMSQALIELLED